MVKIYQQKKHILLDNRRDIKLKMVREDWKELELRIIIKKNVNIPAFGSLLLPDFLMRLNVLFDEFKELGVKVYIGYKLVEDE